jgi:hypothetical protein
MVALAWALWRRRRAGRHRSQTQPASRPRSVPPAWLAAVAVSSVLLVGLLVASFLTDRALALLPRTDA